MVPSALKSSNSVNLQPPGKGCVCESKVFGCFDSSGIAEKTGKSKVFFLRETTLPSSVLNSYSLWAWGGNTPTVCFWYVIKSLIKYHVTYIYLFVWCVWRILIKFCSFSWQFPYCVIVSSFIYVLKVFLQTSGALFKRPCFPHISLSVSLAFVKLGCTSNLQHDCIINKGQNCDPISCNSCNIHEWNSESSNS